MVCLSMSNYQQFLQIYEFIEGQQNIYIIMEYIQEGDLYDVWKKKKLKDQEILQIISKVAIQLQQFHKYQIYHGDIKLENILIKKVNDTQIPILIDFGCAIVNKTQAKKSELIGTPGFIAPEIIEKYFSNELINKDYNEKCEVFSLGIILYFLLYNKLPFNGTNSSNLLLLNKECQIDYPQKPMTPTNIINLLKCMLKSNPEERISISETLMKLTFRPKKFAKTIISSQKLPLIQEKALAKKRNFSLGQPIVIQNSSWNISKKRLNFNNTPMNTMEKSPTSSPSPTYSSHLKLKQLSRKSAFIKQQDLESISTPSNSLGSNKIRIVKNSTLFKLKKLPQSKFKSNDNNENE